MLSFERMVGRQRWLLLVSPDKPEAMPQKFKGQTWASCRLSKSEEDRLTSHFRDVKDLGYAVVCVPSDEASV